MSSSLFGMISLAGDASLDELRARGIGDPASFSTELAMMLRDGTVALSSSQNPEQPLAVADLLAFAGTAGAVSKTYKAKDNPLALAIYNALKDDEVATAITVSPTTKGFRRSF